MDWRFLHPWMLVFLVVPLAAFVWEWLRAGRRRPAVLFSGLAPLVAAGTTWRVRLVRLLPMLRALALMLAIVALARPQYGQVERRQTALGIDIALVLDVSGSMDFEDFPPNRLDAAKEVLRDFVDGRINDRMSVVLFGTSASLLCPPTFDRDAIGMLVDSVGKHTFAQQDRMTAIGDGLALAIRQLEGETDRSRIVVLLTDGDNNAGRINPFQAAEAARALGVRVYTIGMGTNSRIPVQRHDLFGRIVTEYVQVTIDESALERIADMTGGRYFPANDPEALRKVYEEIDELERADIETSQYDNFDERFLWFLIPALGLVSLELLLRGLWLGRLP